MGKSTHHRKIEEQIKNSPAKQVISTRMAVTDSDLEPIFAELVKSKKDLEEIYLNHNKISDQGVNTIVQTTPVEQAKKFTFINLEFNQISIEGARMLYHHFPNAQFALAGNRIQDASEVDFLEKSRSTGNAAKIQNK